MQISRYYKGYILIKGGHLETGKKAKDYVYGAISSKVDLGKGKGSINHMYKFDLGDID